MFLGKIPKKKGRVRRKIEEKVARAERRLDNASKRKEKLEYARGVKGTWLNTKRLLPRRGFMKRGREKRLEKGLWWHKRREMEGFYDV